jgi:hypothetical protein
VIPAYRADLRSPVVGNLRVGGNTIAAATPATNAKQAAREKTFSEQAAEGVKTAETGLKVLKDFIGVFAGPPEEKGEKEEKKAA